jgi:hypothetical protein
MLFPVCGKRFSTSSKRSDWLWVSPGAHSLGIKGRRRQVCHSSPPSVEVKNEWSYIRNLPPYATKLCTEKIFVTIIDRIINVFFDIELLFNLKTQR